jgi:hypothetical protein
MTTGKRASSGTHVPMKITKRFTSWSYSRFNDYIKCPLKAALKHLVKVNEPAGPALARGSAIDQLCTDYASGKLKDCPEELLRFKDDFDALRKIRRKLHLQQELAFTKTWEETDWRDWDNAWVRIKMDCYYEAGTVLKVIDFKTGKIYPDNEKQMDLYAVGAILKASAQVETVETELWYLDQPGDNIVAKTYTREEAMELQAAWEKDVKGMLADATFKPTPSQDACLFCFFGQKAKNDPRKRGPGLCKY